MKKQILKIGVPLLTMALTGILLVTSCKKDKNETKSSEDSAICISNISFTDCHPDLETKGPYNSDSIAINISNKTVYVTHYNLTVNCGWQDIDVQCRTSNDSVYVREIEISPAQANCICETNNSFQINNLPGGRTFTFVFESCYPTIYKTVSIN